MRSIRFSSFLLALFVAYGAPMCYFPNGVESPNDTPCYPDRANSTCCGSGLACLSNGLCGITPYRGESKEGNSWWYVRGTCTDKSFTDSTCLRRCMKESTGELSGIGRSVRQCLVGARDRYYCESPVTQSMTISQICFDAITTNDDNLFQADGNPSTATIIGKGTAVPTSIFSTSTSATTSVPTGAHTTPSESLSTPTSTSTTNPPSKGTDYSVPIGLGVGIPMGVAAFGLVGFLWFRSRRLNHNSEEKGGRPPQYYGHSHVELEVYKNQVELGAHPDPLELPAESKSNLHPEQKPWIHSLAG